MKDYSMVVRLFVCAVVGSIAKGRHLVLPIISASVCCIYFLGELITATAVAVGAATTATFVLAEKRKIWLCALCRLT